MVFAAIAAVLIAVLPRAGSALAQSCAPRSPIIAARSSIPYDSALPDCDSRGRPLSERPVDNYVSPLDPEYGERIVHGMVALPAPPPGAVSEPSSGPAVPSSTASGS
jgi:hypothetical protein